MSRQHGVQLWNVLLLLSRVMLSRRSFLTIFNINRCGTYLQFESWGQKRILYDIQDRRVCYIFVGVIVHL